MAHDQSATPGAAAGRRVRWSERRAYGALTRAGFADAAIATAVLRQVQVLTSTVALARLDYRTPDAAQAAIGNLIAAPTAAKPEPEPDPQENSQPEEAADTGDRDAQLLTAAARIVAAANRDGGHLSQAALAEKLRGEGYTVANNRLRWLSSTIGLDPRHAVEPARRPLESQ